MIKVELYRGIGVIGLLEEFVVQYEGKVEDLLKKSEYNVRYMPVFMLKKV